MAIATHSGPAPAHGGTWRERLATAGTGRHVTTYVLMMVVAAETDEAAFAKWEHYKAGLDHEAVAWMGQQGSADTRSGADTNVRQMTDTSSPSAVNINMGTLVGSYASVARMLDEMAEVCAAP